MEEQKVKIHLRDIQGGKENRETPIFILGDKKWWADRITKDAIATHNDCCECNNEFEKKYTHQRMCEACGLKKDNEMYLKLPLVDWDGKIPLTLYGGDERYFFDSSDLFEYCEDNDLDVSALKLVTCYETSFPEIDVYEQLNESVHEDWEPEEELAKLIDSLNTYLSKASTRTWMPDSKRVSLQTKDLR